jgi:hypothetical protein
MGSSELCSRRRSAGTSLGPTRKYSARVPEAYLIVSRNATSCAPELLLHTLRPAWLLSKESWSPPVGAKITAKTKSRRESSAPLQSEIDVFPATATPTSPVSHE